MSTYSIARDTAAGKVDSSLLRDELVAAVGSAPGNLAVAGDVLRIEYDGPVNQQTVDNTVASHAPPDKLRETAKVAQKDQAVAVTSNTYVTVHATSISHWAGGRLWLQWYVEGRGSGTAALEVRVLAGARVVGRGRCENADGVVAQSGFAVGPDLARGTAFDLVVQARIASGEGTVAKAFMLCTITGAELP